MMAMVQCGQPGVEIRQNVQFSTLEGTGTYSVRFRRAFIADDMMLADPLGCMVSRIRPGFVLLQTGMGLGVIRASIDAMRQADKTQAATNRFLPRRPDYFEAGLAGLQTTLMTLAGSPTDGSGEYVRDVLQARLKTGELTPASDRGRHADIPAPGRSLPALPYNGGSGEGYFVAMITPSSRHLTQELSRMAAN